MRFLHGKPLAEKLHEQSRERSSALAARGVAPRLAVVSVGIVRPRARPATTFGAREEARHRGREVDLSGDTQERQLVTTLERLGADPRTHGILLLTPLPGALDEGHIVDHIVPAKDVEGMNPFNVGLLADGRPRFVPSTAEAVVELLKFHGIELRGARATVIGRSTVIGRPAAYLLLKEDATVTIAHSQTKDVRRSEGFQHRCCRRRTVGSFERHDRAGATVIDAGINVSPRLVGYVDVESVSSVAGALSPVRVAWLSHDELLLRNVLTAAERQQED